MSGIHRAPSRTRASLTRKGKLLATAVTVTLVAGGALAYFVLVPEKAPAFVRQTLQTVGLVGPEAGAPDPTCPLTGEAVPSGKIPDRPALAIKVENHPDARPQAALNDADVVVEEPVEGGYTRFIAIFQCDDADRVGPVRSGRTTDPDYLRQLGPAVFGYAGGVNAVKTEVPRVGLVDVNYIIAADAYTRDDSRSAPHDLYSATAKLWKAAGNPTGAPGPLFSYSEEWNGTSRRATVAHLPYSSVSDVVWTWRPAKHEWFRSHGDVPHMLEGGQGDVPHMLEGGQQVSATNVVIQVVEVTASQITDAAGNYSPDVELTGSGKAFVLRDGRVIVGRWKRPKLGDVTTFVARDGEEVTLAPGRTWVQLLPTSVALELSRR